MRKALALTTNAEQLGSGDRLEQTAFADAATDLPAANYLPPAGFRSNTHPRKPALAVSMPAADAVGISIVSGHEACTVPPWGLDVQHCDTRVLLDYKADKLVRERHAWEAPKVTRLGSATRAAHEPRPARS